MGLKGKKIFWIVVSVMFLMIFLNYAEIRAIISNKVISVSLLKEEKLISMLEEKEELPDKEMTVKFNGYPVSYDQESNTIFLPQALNGNNLQGKLTTDAGKLYLKEDAYLKKAEDAIREGHLFELYQIEETGYHCYRLVFTGMPIMRLSAQSSRMEGEAKINQGIVEVYDPYRAATRFQRAECTFRVRGGTSFGYPKSNYKLELTDKKLSFLGMRKDEDWILNSLYDDAGLIHNKVSAQVWREISSYNNVTKDEGTTMEYVEVFIDNEYRGVYALTERIDAKELSLDKADILYKCRATRIPEEHNYSNEDVDGMRPIFILKYPLEFEDKDWEPLKDWVNYFLKEESMNYAAGEKLLNMENAIDSTLFCLLIGGKDNLRKNMFFLAEYQSDGTYQFKKIPWDMNASWGNPWVDYEECNYTLYDSEYYKDVTTWITDMGELYYRDEIKVSFLLYERWKELRQRGVITPEKIFEMFNKEFAYLYGSGAYTRNYERWPNGTEYWQDDYVYEYTEKRIAFLDQYFEQLYLGNLNGAVYENVDYSNEFEARYYWETHYETLSQLYSYDKQTLLEHYVLYGKPFGLQARKE